MGVIQYFKDIADAQSARTELGKLRVKTQHLVDIISGTDDEETGTYRGNEYRTYSKSVSAVNKKYNGSAKWGTLQTRNIIDLRAAFIISRGIKISAREKGVDASREIKWAQAFLEFNDLDKEMPQIFAIEAEIEAKILLTLGMDETPKISKYEEFDYKMPAVRYVSWTDKKYKVKTADDDYRKYESVVWSKIAGQKEELEPGQFVFNKFGGRINDPNNAQSKVMCCLTQIDNLDKALRDWREIDRVFGGPILYMKCADKKEVGEAMTALEDKNFKIKKVLAGTGDLSFVTLDMGGINSIEKEILTIAKMISGTTGVSVQYMGLVELLKNRSTGDDMREGLSSATVKDRAIWEGTYEELIEKAIDMFNQEVYGQKSDGAKLNPSLIKVSIPVITKQQWDNIKDIWLPAAVSGQITRELFLEQLPDINPEDELKRQEEKDASELDQLKKENEDLKNKDDEFPFMGDEGE